MTDYRKIAKPSILVSQASITKYHKPGSFEQQKLSQGSGSLSPGSGFRQDCDPSKPLGEAPSLPSIFGWLRGPDLEATRGGSFLAFHLWMAPGVPDLEAASLYPPSSRDHPPSGCLSSIFWGGHQSQWIRAHPHGLMVTPLYLQRLYFQIRPHSQIPEAR